MHSPLGLKVAIVGYRDWAFDVYGALEFGDCSGLKAVGLQCFWVTTSTSEFRVDSAFKFEDPSYYVDFKAWLSKNNVDLVVFAGWSWLIPKDLIEDYICLCIHPGDLRKYRGGSPIQHQILDRCTHSTVTIFRMTEELDWGPIFGEREICLDGYIPDIFCRLSDASVMLLRRIIEDAIFNRETLIKDFPDFEKGPILRRRKPNESTIVIDDILKMPLLDFYNLFRSLSGPYPHLRIDFGSDGSLFLVKNIYRFYRADYERLHKTSSASDHVETILISCLDDTIAVSGIFE